MINHVINMNAIGIKEQRDWEKFLSHLSYTLGYRERYLDTPQFVLFGPLLTKPWEKYTEQEKGGWYQEPELDPYAYLWLHQWDHGFIDWKTSAELVERFAPVIVDLNNSHRDDLLMPWQKPMYKKLKYLYMIIYDAAVAHEHVYFARELI